MKTFCGDNRKYLLQEYPFYASLEQQASLKEKSCLLKYILREITQYSPPRNRDEYDNGKIAYFFLILHNEAFVLPEMYFKLYLQEIIAALKVLLIETQRGGQLQSLPLAKKLMKVLEEKPLSICKRIGEEPERDHSIVQWLKSCFSGCFS